MSKLRMNTKMGVYALLVFYLFFDSYRYICGVGGVGTSSEGAAPLLANILKGIIWIVLLVYPLCMKKHIRILKRNYIPVLLLLLIAVQKIYLILGTDICSTRDVLLLLMVMTTVSYMICNFQVEVSVLDRIFMLFFVFTTIYDVVQIFLALNMVKLPRHAMLTGFMTDIRFGGAWDDPNSYGIFMTFYLMYFYGKYKGIKRYVFMGGHILIF